MTRSEAGPDPLAVLAELARSRPRSADGAIAFALDALARAIRPVSVSVVEVRLDGARLVERVTRPGVRREEAEDAWPSSLAATLVGASHAVQLSSGEDRALLAAPVRSSSGAFGLVVALDAERSTDEETSQIEIVAGWLGAALERIQLDRERAELVAVIERELKSTLGEPIADSQALVRALHGKLTGEQRRAVLRLEQAVHRAILTNLDLLDWERVRTRGFEVDEAEFAIEEVVDHVTSRQGASLELARVQIERRITRPSPRCRGDLVRTERALSILVRAIVDRIREPREMLFETEADDRDVRLLVSASVADPEHFLSTLASPPRPPALGEPIVLARGWIEAQGGSLSMDHRGDRLLLVLRLPAGRDH